MRLFLVPLVCLPLVVAVPSAADEIMSLSLDEVQDCVDQNRPRESIVQKTTLVARDRTGEERQQVAVFHMKYFEDESWRVFIEIEDPPDLRGSTYLMIQNPGVEDIEDVETFVYLPDLKRVRRISPSSASGSLFGTDFSYEDFQHFQNVAESSGSVRQPDDDLEGRPVYVVEQIPGPDSGSAYSRVVSLVDKETCVVRKTDFYEKAETPRKRLRVDPAKIERQGESWLPTLVTMRDEKDGTLTTMTVLESKVDGGIPDRYFTVRHLERGR